MALLWRLGLVTVRVSAAQGVNLCAVGTFFADKLPGFVGLLVCYRPLASFSKLRVLVKE